jgi:folylpolyglutamate synthase/dihydropteroate synthase
MQMKRLVFGLLVGVLIMLGSTYRSAAQEPSGLSKAAPALTTEQKQALQILSQRLELAQLHAQAAQRDFDDARKEIATLVQSLQRDGYELDLNTLGYRPMPKAVPK